MRESNKILVEDLAENTSEQKIERLNLVLRDINNQAVSYLRRKASRVERDERQVFETTLNRLSDIAHPISISDPAVLATLRKSFGGEETLVNRKASQLEAFHNSARSVLLTRNAVRRFSDVQAKAEEVVEYATSGMNLERKKLIKEKGYKSAEMLTNEDRYKIEERFNMKQDGLISEYKAVRIELDQTRAKAKECSEKSLSAPIGILKAIGNFFRNLFAILTGRKSTKLILQSFQDPVNDNLVNALDKTVDYAVQAQISVVNDDKLDLFCYPQYNIAGSVSAYYMQEGKSEEGFELKISMAERAFSSVSAVISETLPKLLKGDAGQSLAMVKARLHEARMAQEKGNIVNRVMVEMERGGVNIDDVAADVTKLVDGIMYGRVDYSNLDIADKYVQFTKQVIEEARLAYEISDTDYDVLANVREAVAPVANDAESLQELYGNLLILETEMLDLTSALRRDNMFIREIPDLHEQCFADIAEAKNMIKAQAREKSIDLVEEKSKTLADKISDAATESLSSNGESLNSLDELDESLVNIGSEDEIDNTVSLDDLRKVSFVAKEMAKRSCEEGHAH